VQQTAAYASSPQKQAVCDTHTPGRHSAREPSPATGYVSPLDEGPETFRFHATREKEVRVSMVTNEAVGISHCSWLASQVFLAGGLGSSGTGTGDGMDLA